MKRILKYLFLIPLLAGIIFLSHFIYRSARQSAQIDQAHFYGEAVRDIERAALYASENIKSLYTALDLSDEELQKKDYSHLEALIAKWQADTSNAQFIGRIFVFDGVNITDLNLSIYNEEMKDPIDLSVIIYQLAKSRQREIPGAPQVFFSGNNVLLVKSLGQNKDNTRIGILIDYHEMLKLEFEEGLKIYAGDFNFRLILGEKILFSRLYNPARKADLEINLSPGDFFFSWRVNSAGKETLIRNFQRPEFRNEPPESDRENPVRSFLELQLKDQTIDNYIRNRMLTTLLINYGLLFLLVLTCFVLWRLYARNREIRNQEKEFVASVTHELKTPLAVIRSAAGNLIEGIIKEPGKINRYAKLIDREALRLNRQVESILFYSGLETNNPLSGIQQFLPEEIVGSIIEMFEDLAVREGIELNFKNRMKKHLISGDPVLFRQLAENLIQNAIRHGNGSENPVINVILELKVPHKWVFVVEDNGMGISRKEQKAVFKPFSRGKFSIRENTPGTGLGLYLVKKAAFRMNAILTLESPWLDKAEKDHSGCRFSVEFLQESES